MQDLFQTMSKESPFVALAVQVKDYIKTHHDPDILGLTSLKATGAVQELVVYEGTYYNSREDVVNFTLHYDYMVTRG